MGGAAALVAATLALSACTADGSGSTSSTSSTSSTPTASSSADGAASAGPSSATGSTASPTGAPGAVAPVDGRTPDEYSSTVVPEAQIQAAIGKVDGIATDALSRTGIPGLAVAVVHGGKVVYAKGFGVREVGKPETVDPDTVFQIASVSKSIGSTCVSKAVTDGIVKWSDPIVKYLPDFELSDPAVTQQVTIADFYSHRSGLPEAAGDDLEGFGFDRAQVLAALHEFPLNPFRISYGYSNFGMTTGAEAVAKASGMSWEDLCAKELYGPLGMTSTSSKHADFVARADKATIHFPTGDKTFAPLYTRDADAQSPAGGVSSTVDDLAKWMLMNLAGGKVDGQQLIDAAVLQESHNPQIAHPTGTKPDERSRFYGYGFNVESTSTGVVKWSHSGAFYVGAGTAYAMIPSADVGIVVLSNAAPLGAVEAITTSFTDLVTTGTVQRDWLAYYGAIFQGLFVNHSVVAAPAPASPAPARPLSDYVGTYANSYVGAVTVSLSGDTLSLTIGPKGLTAPLTHYDGDVFSWLPPGGNGDPVSAVTFSGGGGAQATTVAVEAVRIGTLLRTS